MPKSSYPSLAQALSGARPQAPSPQSPAMPMAPLGAPGPGAGASPMPGQPPQAPGMGQAMTDPVDQMAQKYGWTPQQAAYIRSLKGDIPQGRSVPQPQAPSNNSPIDPSLIDMGKKL